MSPRLPRTGGASARANLRRVRAIAPAISWTATLLLCAAPLLAAGPATRVECEAAGGTWSRVGIRQQELCNLPTPDGGKACTDARDCASACVAPESAPVGSRATGACYERTLLVGKCLKHVRDGVVGEPLCAD
jgi:hypothetical protein